MKRLLLILVALCVAATGANAAVLWDQSDYDALNQLGMWNAVSGCAPFGGTIHYANDIMIYDYVTINQIHTWYTPFNFDTLSATEAWLMIVPKTGPLPSDATDLPQTVGTLVTISVTTDVNGIYEITADGLTESLVPGEYWVSLTPILPGGMWGPDYHIRSMTNWGEPAVWYEYCGQFAPAWGTNIDNLDGSMLIEGTIDIVPTEDTSWGSLKALYE